MRAAFTVLGCAFLLTRCSERLPRGEHTLEQFSFVTTNMTIQEVTNRLGAPDAITGRGVPRFEYYLTDRTHVLIWPFDWGSPTSHVMMMTHGTNYLLPRDVE